MTAAPDAAAPRRVSVDTADAVQLSLLLGRILFSFEATAQRIQDSIACLARYLGCKVETLVSYDALLITVNDSKGFRTRIDSARGVAGLNLLGVTRVSKLLRELSHSQPGVKELEQTLCAIRDAPHSHRVALQALAAGCAGVSFCIVNGGDPASWLCSFVAGAFIFAMRRPLVVWKINIHVTLFATALAGSFLTALLARITQTSTPAIALLGPILFLVPGVPIINGGIDVVRNHVTIGIARVGFALAATVALCLGVGLTASIVPVRISSPFSLPGAWGIFLVSVAGALASGALACLNNGKLPLISLCALGGLTGRLVRALLTDGGFNLIGASLIAVLCSTLVVGFIAERLRLPSVFVAVMAALPMVPGYFVIAGLHSLLTFAAAQTPDPAQLSAGLQTLARAVFISIALVIGVIGPVIILQSQRERV
jgi:uncharacterized membrane protein YjjP (DUF1212 family)